MRPHVVATLTVAAVLGLGVGLGHAHPFGDPRAESANGLGASLQGADLPASAKRVLIAKCADCHSSETRWPAYARVAPGSWLIEQDIVEARKHMDLSRWSELPREQHQVLEAKIAQQARTGSMPPLQYVALHWGAKLSKDDVQALSGLGRSAGGSEAALTGAGDPVHGKVLFERRCTGCHALDTNREGPRLTGVYGRKAGSVAGFNYSAGLKSSGITWTDETLEGWLSDPELMVKDNNMDFQVPKAEERRDLIAYFKTIKGLDGRRP